MTAQASARVRDLIVVLDVGNEPGRRLIQGWSAAPRLLPGIALPLIKIAPLHGREKFLGAAQKIRIVGFAASRQSHHGAVVEIVIPDAVESVATLLPWPYQLAVL